jgi:hypothetical protein
MARQTAPFWQKESTKITRTISEYLKVKKYSLGSAIILERLCLNETSLDER